MVFSLYRGKKITNLETVIKKGMGVHWPIHYNLGGTFLQNHIIMFKPTKNRKLWVYRKGAFVSYIIREALDIFYMHTCIYTPTHICPSTPMHTHTHTQHTRMRPVCVFVCVICVYVCENERHFTVMTIIE